MTGRAFVLGDNISTDALAPGHSLKLPPDALANQCLEAVRSGFAKDVRPGDFVVAGKNFGQGSSREQAVESLKLLGVTAVISTSFARIFYRNAINMGLPPITFDPIGKIHEHDKIAIDLQSGTLRNLTTGAKFGFRPFPSHLQTIIKAGGLLPFLETKLAR